MQYKTLRKALAIAGAVPLLALGAQVASAQVTATTTTPNTGAGAETTANLALMAGSLVVLAAGTVYLRRAYQQS